MTIDVRTRYNGLLQGGGGGGGGGGGEGPRISVAQSACQYDVTSRVSNFQNILFRFLGFGDVKVAIVIEN